MPTALLRTALALALVATAAASASADDVYYRVPISQLKFSDGPPPNSEAIQWWHWQRAAAMAPYARLAAPGEVIVAPSQQDGNSLARPDFIQATVFVRAAQPGEVKGRLFFPKPDLSGLVIREFTIPASDASADAEKAFKEAKHAYYRQLQARDIPGTAWFRHQAREAGGQLPDNAPARFAQFDRAGRLQETYALFSGGRAVSENLQLDRQLRNTPEETATVELSSIDGITVPEMDWRALVKDLKPALDPLAKHVPADQHVVFFHDFAAAVRTADESQQQGTPILHVAEPRSEDARTAERYQRQLGLSLSGLGRLLGPQVAASVALTGSDPYYRVGTDVAVLFETPNPALLQGLLLAQINMAAAKTPGAKPEQGSIEGLVYHGVRSPDRTVCSYVASLDHAVVVTNSLYQLRRLAEVASKKSPSIASLDEYVFFRNRYRLDDPEETALLFLSDATIRRWCGPHWRIATSRRTRDMAVLAELQAANVERLAKKNIEPGQVYTDLAAAHIGQLSLDADGIRSSTEGSLEFMTPIAEVELTKVSRAEADAYGRWRDGYQRNWSWAFDPIALRLTLGKDRTGADLSVMPLILGTEYRSMIQLSSGASLAPNAGDPHDALLHLILAINTNSDIFRRNENFVSTMSQGVTLGWLGDSVSLYLDDDPVWAELAKLAPEKRDAAMSDYFGRLPIAIRAEVKNSLKLTAFLASLRAFVEQTAPGMVRWESLTYKEQPYVKISPTEHAKSQQRELEKVSFYYLATGDSLLVTVNENLLKRAIERRIARKAKPEGDKTTAAAAENVWLGSNFAARVDRKAIDILAETSRQSYQEAMQLRAWANLPILNEWKRLYPEQDPVELHERLWKIRLICPGGGRYVWNEKFQTMESTVYGHPGEPRLGSGVPVALERFSSASFGLTFENQGLRARVMFDQTKQPEQSKDHP